MKEFVTENNGENTNLIYNVSANEKIDTVTLGMMENNSIVGLLPMIYTQVNQNRILKYNISSKITMAQLFESNVTKERIVKCFGNIIDGIVNAKSYLIEPNSFVIDMEHIYVNVGTLEVGLICLPVMDIEEEQNLEMFFKNIIFSSKFDQSENCDYVAKIISYLNSGNFIMKDFRRLLDEIMGNTPAPAPEQVNNVNTASESVAVTPMKEMQAVTVVDASAFNKAQINKPVEVQSVNIPQPQVAVIPIQEPNDKKAKKLQAKLEKEQARKEKEQAKKEKKGGLFSKKEKEPKNNAVPVTPIPGMAIPGMEAEIPVKAVNKPNTINNINNNVQESVSIQMPQIPQPQFTQTSANFGETTVLGVQAAGETTVLGVSGMETAAYTPKPYLVRKKNNEKVLISKSVFKIGKENSYADYFIGDNTAISRSHASIIVKGDSYYIMDTNSKNHTFVEGNMIQPNMEVPIKPGMKIRLADEEFEFIMQ